MKKFSEILFLSGVGGSLYYGVEVIYRGFSHWTMFLLGGICMLFIGKQGEWCQWKDPFWKQWFRSTVFVMCSEFITGMLVNKWMKWDIWDYSDQRFQLFGQTCLLFISFFSILCILGMKVSKYILVKMYKH